MLRDRPTVAVLNFRTFGDYVLRAPFYHEVFARYPGARVVVLTNTKGALTLPFVDSRLELYTFDRGMTARQLVREFFRLPRIDVLYSTDGSRICTSLALLLPAKVKIGWCGSDSVLYDTDGFQLRSSRDRLIGWLIKHTFTKSYLRLPEDQHDSKVELQLLGEESDPRPLHAFRSAFAFVPPERVGRPAIYCSGEAGWICRQLAPEVWIELLQKLLARFPSHDVVYHLPPATAEKLPIQDRLRSLGDVNLNTLFQTIATADLVISADSFALHIASFYNVPSVGYFGPARPHRFQSTADRSASVAHPPECSPCVQRRGTDPCALGLERCLSLDAITSEELFQAAESMLGIPREPGYILPAMRP